VLYEVVKNCFGSSYAIGAPIRSCFGTIALLEKRTGVLALLSTGSYPVLDSEKKGL
jgi:hypothetical protein